MFEGFKGFEELEEAFREFDSRVPHGEEAFMVLKAHLVTERALVEFVRARVADAEFDTQFLGGDSPCRNGLGLIILAQGLSLRDEVPQTHADIVWPALKMLNRIRNTLAHELDPDSSKVRTRMATFVKLVDEDMLNIEPDINKAFRKCAGLLVVYLHIDKQPLLASDTY